MVADCDNGGLYHAYKASNINYEVRSDEYCESQNPLTEEQKNKIRYFTDIYKLNEFDILANNNNKLPAVSSVVRDIPLIHKGNRDMFYLKPLKKIDFIKSDKPVLKIKRIIKEEDIKQKNKKIVETPKVKQNNNVLYGIIALVLVLIIVLIFIIMR